MFDWLRKLLWEQPWKKQTRWWIHRGDYVDTIEPDGRYLCRVFYSGTRDPVSNQPKPGMLEIHSADEILELFHNAWLKHGPHILVIGRVVDPKVGS